MTFGLFTVLFSANALYFNLYGFPSRHGFGGGPWMQLPKRGVIPSALRLTSVSVVFWKESQWLLLLVGLCYAVELYANQAIKVSAVEWLRKNRWAVFHFVALAGLPFAIIFAAKVGGDVNSFSVHLYFCLIGLLLFIGQHMLARRDLARPVVVLCFMLAATILPVDPAIFRTPVLIQKLSNNHTQQVYRYAKQHPGETYFSGFLLPVLMAEGRMYHFEYGIFDRELGDARVSEAHFLQYVPREMKFVQRQRENSPVTKYLPNFSCLVERPAFLDDLSFYTDCSAGTTR
jgi:hypothetical protein